MSDWNLAICDDEAVDRELIFNYVKQQYDQDWTITQFSSAKDLLRSAEETHFDLILLDIEMAAPTGFEAAKQLMATQTPRPLIIFTTKSNAYTIKGYGIAFRYLVKPVTRDDFALAMDAALGELSANRFTFSYNNDLLSIPFQAIYFIESFAHLAVIHTNDEEFRIRATLSEVKQKLPLTRFAMPHKSYLVNMAHINTVLSDDIILTNGARVPISRRKRQEFNADFCRFLGR